MSVRCLFSYKYLSFEFFICANVYECACEEGKECVHLAYEQVCKSKNEGLTNYLVRYDG